MFDQENKFFSILGHQPATPDPESGSAIRKNAGSVSGTALNQCGSATMVSRGFRLEFIDAEMNNSGCSCRCPLINIK
jgi:hypothetical protein